MVRLPPSNQAPANAFAPLPQPVRLTCAAYGNGSRLAVLAAYDRAEKAHLTKALNLRPKCAHYDNSTAASPFQILPKSPHHYHP